MRYEIKIHPKPKARPRFSASGHAYTPKETQEYEKAIRLAIGNPKPYEKWAIIGIEFMFALPKAATKREKQMVETYGKIQMHKRPDIDNLVKSVLDAVNNGVLVSDDSIICRLTATKVYGQEDKITIICEGE